MGGGHITILRYRSCVQRINHRLLNNSRWLGSSRGPISFCWTREIFASFDGYELSQFPHVMPRLARNHLVRLSQADVFKNIPLAHCQVRWLTSQIIS